MSYKVTLDLALCQGYANCIIEGPEVFDFNDDTDQAMLREDSTPGPEGALLREARPAGELRAQAEAAARGCPVRAIAVIEDSE